MAYGAKREEVIGAVQRLAVEVVADRVAHGELPEASFNLAFSVKDEQMAGIRGSHGILRDLPVVSHPAKRSARL